MPGAHGNRWTGTKRPSRRYAILVLSLSSALVLLAVLRAAFFEGPIDPFFMAMLATFGMIYFGLVLVSSVEIAVELGDDAMSVAVREVVGRPIRHRTYELRREDFELVSQFCPEMRAALEDAARERGDELDALAEGAIDPT